MKNYTLENHRGFIRYASKTVHEWNSHLEIFRKILGDICFSEQIFYRKQSSGAPDITNNHRSMSEARNLGGR